MDIFEKQLAIHDGYKALISSILNLAVEDGLLYQRPRPPTIRGLTKIKKIRLLVGFCWCMRVIKEQDKHSLAVIHFCMKFILRYYELLARKTTSIREELAYEARKYINHHDRDFATYCHFLDVDSLYFEEKAHQYFYQFDHNTLTNPYKGRRLT